jgi:hypothetical protein
MGYVPLSDCCVTACHVYGCVCRAALVKAFGRVRRKLVLMPHSSLNVHLQVRMRREGSGRFQIAIRRASSVSLAIESTGVDVWDGACGFKVDIFCCVVFWVAAQGLPGKRPRALRVGSLHAFAASLACSAADRACRIVARQARVFLAGIAMRQSCRDRSRLLIIAEIMLEQTRRLDDL